MKIPSTENATLQENDGETVPPNSSGVKSVGKISAAIAISRILGLVREVVLAKYFGAGFAADAFYVAYRIPDMLRDLFMEGTLSAGLLPVFVRRMKTEGKNSAWLLANRLINASLLLLGAATLAIFFGAKICVYLQAAGFASIPGKLELSAQMIRVMSPFLLCVSLAAVFMGMLNACGSFFIPALSPSIFNVCCILSGVLLSPFMPGWGLEPVVSMAFGALAGGIGQFVIMIPSARARGFRYRWTLDLFDPDLRRVGKLLIPAILGLSATQINVIVDSQLAAQCGNGPISWLGYAFRLTQLPIGVFGIAIATVAAANVAHYAAARDFAGLRLTLDSSLRLSACLTFPAMVGLIIFRNEIVQLLFQRDQFHSDDTLQTGWALLCYAFALCAYSAIRIIAPAFYALGDNRTPFRFSMISVAVKVALSLILIKIIGFQGLAISTAAAAWLNCVWLRRRLIRAGGDSYGEKDGGQYLRILLASLAMGLISWVVFQGSFHIARSSGFSALAFRLGSAILAGIVSLIPLLRLFRAREASELWRIVAKTAEKFR